MNKKDGELPESEGEVSPLGDETRGRHEFRSYQHVAAKRPVRPRNRALAMTYLVYPSEWHGAMGAAKMHDQRYTVRIEMWLHDRYHR